MVLQGYLFPDLKQSILNLENWFLSHKRCLPWRNNPDVYRVWISEIMLQQTQVKTVIPYFEKFLKRFPDVSSLANAQEDEVLLYWAGLGYYSRAKNIYKTSKIIQKQGFPNSRKGWLAMPGVGEYTAGAILSIAQNQNEAILDTNVLRVISRLRMIKVDSKKRLWKLSKMLLDYALQFKIQPSNFNQSLMELGAMICTPKKPQCRDCPLRKSCKAYKINQVENYPPKKLPKKWVHIQEETFALLKDQSILIQKQNTGKWRKGLWDIPHHLPNEIKKTSKFLFEFQVKYTVTKHKVNRTVKVYDFLGCQMNDESNQWMAIDDNLPSIAYGAALKKVIIRLKKSPHNLFQS